MKIKEITTKKRFSSIAEAADFFGINEYAIKLNLEGRKQKVCNKYIFIYIKERKKQKKSEDDIK